jgi:hypothetical protein
MAVLRVNRVATVSVSVSVFDLGSISVSVFASALTFG